MSEERRDPEVFLQELRKEDGQKTRGHLKIFFGYATGAGKTCAMLKAAHETKARGVDVVAGYIEPHARRQTAALTRGLETLPPLDIPSDDIHLMELDLDAALRRAPALILVDELAHTNAEGCRHAKRYQDVEELLKHGVDVYTTVNVQHIESLPDIVASITGEVVRERIPDSVFDSADQVELVDIEPQELLERLGNDRNQRAAERLFTLENLTALREIALRRCADRVNLLTEGAGGRPYHTDEHILVCLSSAPSNPTIIRTAARMAGAFHGAFTALFVETPDFSSMSEEDKKRLRANIRLAQQLGAKIETVFGEDVPTQIAEFARLSGVSKIVIGQSAVGRRGMFSKPSLTERLIATAPNMDIHIIPDVAANGVTHRAVRVNGTPTVVFSVADILKSVGLLAAASVIGTGFDLLGFSDANIITVYILGVLLTAVVTQHQIYGLVSAIVSVLVFNFLFTEPRYTLLAYDEGYPVTFLVMFLAAFLTGSLALRLKESAKQSAQAAYRTKILFDTNQLLQQAAGREDIAAAAAGQLTKLLERDVVVYLNEGGTLSQPLLFPASAQPMDSALTAESERSVATWVLKNNKHAGATTDTFSNARCLYFAIRITDSVYGVVGIVVGQTPLDAFENSILLSILGECALALENERNAREKEETAILAKNEQLRANLLRSISHDLRTPLTSISGNASNLLNNGQRFSQEQKQQLYSDIYDDSQWLIDLVENLLAVTRLEEGRMQIDISDQLLDDIVSEALRHVNLRGGEHKITVRHSDELLLAKADARLIVQVIINLVDNAVKYTPPGTAIEITTRQEGTFAIVSVADNGPGISDEAKPRIFDMFYTGANQVADSRRSMGLGLGLCKAIVTAHGGTIDVSDNAPTGAVFTFTLPIGEVELHE